jgi:hypothetical protein
VAKDSSAVPVRASKRVQLQRWLDQHSAREIGEAELDDLRNTLAPISESYLRTLLRESGAELAPLVAGVRQTNLDELESSLIALENEYEQGNAERRAAVRRLVITAMDHARWTLKKTGKRTAKSAPAGTETVSDQPGVSDSAGISDNAAVSDEAGVSDKAEMILWMITWLENPPLFPQWVRLRRTQIAIP